MYKNKGHIKVFNGFKFVTVSYLNEDNTIMFTTSSLSNKFHEFKTTKKIRVLENGVDKTYGVTINDEDSYVELVFKKLKKLRVIPFFIPRKDKVIISFSLK